MGAMGETPMGVGAVRWPPARAATRAAAERGQHGGAATGGPERRDRWATHEGPHPVKLATVALGRECHADGTLRFAPMKR